MVPYCPKCGAPALDDQSLFCNICGTQFPAAIPEKQKNHCPKCTARIPEGEKSCSHCGFLPSSGPSSQPSGARRSCAECGAPVPDETRYYCKTCGAYLRTTHATRVLLHDDRPGSKSSLGRPVIIPGIHQDTGTGTLIREDAVVKKRTADLSGPMVKKAGIAAAALAGAVLLFWIGAALLGSGTVLQPGSDTLVTQDLASLSLTINDLPPGWMSGDAGGTADVYTAQFFIATDTSEGLVEQSITRYPGIEEARLELKNERELVTDIPVETIALGNEGFGYIDVNYVMVLFRQGNLIVKIEDTRTEYQDNPTLQNARKYAEIIAKRIT